MWTLRISLSKNKSRSIHETSFRCFVIINIECLKASLNAPWLAINIRGSWTQLSTAKICKYTQLDTNSDMGPTLDKLIQIGLLCRHRLIAPKLNMVPLTVIIHGDMFFWPALTDRTDNPTQIDSYHMVTLVLICLMFPTWLRYIFLSYPTPLLQYPWCRNWSVPRSGAHIHPSRLVAKSRCSAWLGAPRAGPALWNYPAPPYGRLINTIRLKGSAWRVLPTSEY